MYLCLSIFLKLSYLVRGRTLVLCSRTSYSVVPRTWSYLVLRRTSYWIVQVSYIELSHTWIIFMDTNYNARLLDSRNTILLILFHLMVNCYILWLFTTYHTYTVGNTQFHNEHHVCFMKSFRTLKVNLDT